MSDVLCSTVETDTVHVSSPLTIPQDNRRNVRSFTVLNVDVNHHPTTRSVHLLTMFLSLSFTTSSSEGRQV